MPSPSMRGINGLLAVNCVGRITAGLDALAHEAPRMRREGMGKMRLSLILGDQDR